MVHRSFSIGDYEVHELIAAGALSFVFGARHRTQARPVAVKILRPHVTRDSGAQQRFLREAAGLRRLSHENVVGILDFGWDDALGVTYLVMERLSGQTADALVRQQGTLAWQEAVPLLVQVCRALASAHALGIIDGHLTAKKVFVAQGTGPLAVKLCDFGFSSATRTTEDAEPRDDVYGIGTVAHELLTGRPPMEGSSAAGPLSDDPIRMNERFPALMLPGKLDDLIWACRLRDAMSRPSLDEIEATLRSLDVAPAAPGVQARAAAAPDPPNLQDVAVAPTTPGAQIPVTASGSQPGGAVSDPLELPEMIGSYRVVAPLGAGGTGRVYLGQHPVIGSKVAIKVLLPEIASRSETVERFLQEARASSQIGSPHIPRYFDFGTTPAGLPYAMMEYFEGETLGDRLERSGTMSVAETAQILEQIASALLMAHEAGLIHRDLKPDNIFLVRPEGKAGRLTGKRAASLGTSGAGANVAPPIQVKVLDFGIAKMVGRPSATQTQNGYFLGTPSYCAPEQVFGGGVDVRTDVYSLGATAFEMLTGSPPFVGEVPEVMAAKATRDPPDLLDFGIPAAVAHTIGKMLARDPDERAASMAWVLDQLDSWPEPVKLDAVATTRPAAGEPSAGAGPGHLTTAAPVADDAPAARAGASSPSTMSPSLYASAPARRLGKPQIALAIAGVVLAVGVVILWIRGSSPHSTAGDSRRWQDVQETVAGSASAPVAAPIAPPLPPPAEPDPRTHEQGTGASGTASGQAAAEGAPGATADSGTPHGSEPPQAGGNRAIGKTATGSAAVEGAPGTNADADQRRGNESARTGGGNRSYSTAAGASDGGAPPGLTGSRRHGARPPADKKLPAKKPPTDVLIVDPFSPSNGSTRRDSP
ncbi:MAG TPA: serine/threonine-protein kinase [Kofleriaceae bacterium]|nr:serine/threonine-protein kinase [Kofleriaceae bacterium]